MLESQTKRLSRSLNTFDLILLGIGCVVGTGIFVITGVAAANDAGPAIIISFILAAIACALAAFATLNSPHPFLCQEASIRIPTQHLGNFLPS